MTKKLNVLPKRTAEDTKRSVVMPPDPTLKAVWHGNHCAKGPTTLEAGVQQRRDYLRVGHEFTLTLHMKVARFVDDMMVQDARDDADLRQMLATDMNRQVAWAVYGNICEVLREVHNRYAEAPVYDPLTGQVWPRLGAEHPLMRSLRVIQRQLIEECGREGDLDSLGLKD